MKTSSYISQLEEQILILIFKNEVLEKEIEELKKKLLLYENPHTPPSLQQIRVKKDSIGLRLSI